MSSSPARRRLLALLALACLAFALAGCGGSDPDPASAPAESSDATVPESEPVGGTPTYGGTVEEEPLISGSDEFVDLGARARVAYDCAQADPVVVEQADISGLEADGADEPGHDYDDGITSETDYLWGWGGSFQGGEPEPAELDVHLFSTQEEADAWAKANADSEAIRYGRSVIRYYGLDDHGDYGEYDAEPIDTTAITNSLHRCFDLAGGFD